MAATDTSTENLDDTALSALLKSSYEDAASYADDVLAREREKAFDYYLGDVYTRAGQPEKDEDVQGRTSVVMREVADIIHQMLPGIIRIFTAGDEVVVYEPRSEEDVSVAEQQTDYVNYLLNADGNCWFTTLYDAVHDALLKKAGIVKWWWDERAQVEEMTFTGLSAMQAQQLRLDPEIDVLEEEATQAGYEPAAQEPPVPGATTGGQQTPAANGVAPVPPVVSIDMRVRRTRIFRGLRVAPVPPEEFIIARDARDIPTAAYCAHRKIETVSSLVAEGHDRDEVEARASADMTLVVSQNTNGGEEAVQRNPGLATNVGASPNDKSLWYVLKVEHFIRMDSDDDGIAELHRIVTLGDGFDYICADDIVPEAGFALGSPVRMPHALIGMSVADQVMDLQDLKTSVVRSTFDSLAQSIFPDMAVVENAVNMDDFLSTEVGRVLRMKAPGMAQPLSQPFIGQAALGVVAYLDQVKASRTGITAASTGLDDKVLQSTTRTAVENTVEKAQERVEMIARTLAETLVRDVFSGVLRCIVRNQDKPRVVRLRNKWVEVDPRFWNADADVQVNLALGRGTDAQRMGFLQQIAMKQEQIITQMGPGNPLVSPSQYRATLGDMLRIAGIKDTSRYFKPLTVEDDARIAQQVSQQEKPKDPAMILAEAEMLKTRTVAETRRQDQYLDFVKAQAEDDRERDKMVMDFLLKAAEIQAKYGAQIDIAAMKAMVERERSAFQNGTASPPGAQQPSPASQMPLPPVAAQRPPAGNVMPMRPPPGLPGGVL